MKTEVDAGAVRGAVKKYLKWLEQNELAMWDVMPQATQGDDSAAVIDFVLNVVADTLSVGRGQDTASLDSTDANIRGVVHQELVDGEYLDETKDFQQQTLNESGHVEINQTPDKLTNKTTGLEEMQMSPATEVPSDDERRSELLSIYSDTYKELEGVKPTWIWHDYKDAPIEEIEAALDELYASQDAAFEREDPDEKHLADIETYEFQDYKRSKGLPRDTEVHPAEKLPRGSSMGQRGRPRELKFNRRTEGRVHEGIINNPDEMSYDDAINFLGGYNETDELQNDIYILDADDDEIEMVHAGMSVGDAIAAIENNEDLYVDPRFEDDYDEYAEPDVWSPDGNMWERVHEGYRHDEVDLLELIADKDPETGEYMMDNIWAGRSAAERWQPEDAPHGEDLSNRPWITPDQWMEGTEYDLYVQVPVNIRRPYGQPFDEVDIKAIPYAFKDIVKAAKNYGNVGLKIRPQVGEMSVDGEWEFA